MQSNDIPVQREVAGGQEAEESEGDASPPTSESNEAGAEAEMSSPPEPTKQKVSSGPAKRVRKDAQQQRATSDWNGASKPQPSAVEGVGEEVLQPRNGSSEEPMSGSAAALAKSRGNTITVSHAHMTFW